MKNAPVIIVKKKRGHGHGHHGGAWKVAYADFVTAMMAFFLVLWIVGQSRPVKAGVAGYFRDPGVLENSRSNGILPGASSSFSARGLGHSGSERHVHAVVRERLGLLDALRRHLGDRPRQLSLHDHRDQRLDDASVPATLVVQAAPVADFSVGVSPGSRTVTQGTSATYTVSVGALNGFSRTVALAPYGLPDRTFPRRRSPARAPRR